MKIESIDVKVSYRVGLGGVDMPKDVLEEIEKAMDAGDEISDQTKYPKAYDWLVDNILEKDCFEWSADIEDLVTK